MLRAAGKLDDAEAIFRGIIELLPDSDVPRVALATIELQRGRFAESLAVCEDALRVHPGSLYARLHHAEALMFSARKMRQN